MVDHSRDARAGRRGGGTYWAAPFVPFLLVGAVLALLPFAMSSKAGAAVGVGGTVLVLSMAALGLEKAGTTLVVLGMFFAPMTRVTVPGAPFATISDVLFVVGFGLLLPILLGRPFRLPWQFVVGSAAMFGMMIISSLTAVGPSESLNLSGRVLVATVLLPAVFAWWMPDVRALVWLAGAYVAGEAVSLAFGIVQGPFLTTGRYIGLSEQPTSFGYAGALSICLLPFIRAKFRPEYRWVIYPAGMVMGMAIWLSGSRTSILVLTVVALMLPLVERSVKMAMGLGAIGTLALIALSRSLDSVDAGSNALSRLLGGSGATASDVERRNGFKVAWGRFVDSPIYGKGFDFQVFLAHNIYMQIAAGIGLLGLVAFGVLLWSLVAPLFHNPHRHPFHLLAYPAVAYIVAGPITPNLGSRYVGVLLALALVGARIARDGDKADEEQVPARTGGLKPTASR